MEEAKQAYFRARLWCSGGFGLVNINFNDKIINQILEGGEHDIVSSLIDKLFELVTEVFYIFDC